MAVRVNESNFDNEVLKAKKLVLVDFYSDSCVPCKQISPILGDLEEEYSDKIKVVKVNVNFDESLAKNYEVMVSPTILFIKNGEEKSRIRGLKKKAELEEIINAIL
ncbi:MAG: Thioredoxin protein [Lachnospiraceae bacterium]|nr:Thioredoxin protein [Lachnospiraceae bacterium]